MGKLAACQHLKLLYCALLQGDAAASLMQPHSICYVLLTVTFVTQSTQTAYVSCWNEANFASCKHFQCIKLLCCNHVFCQE